MKLIIAIFFAVWFGSNPVYVLPILNNPRRRTYTQENQRALLFGNEYLL